MFIIYPDNSKVGGNAANYGVKWKLSLILKIKFSKSLQNVAAFPENWYAELLASKALSMTCRSKEGSACVFCLCWVFSKQEEALPVDVVLLILVGLNLGLYPKSKNLLLKIDITSLEY